MAHRFHNKTECGRTKELMQHISENGKADITITVNAYISQYNNYWNNLKNQVYHTAFQGITYTRIDQI